ncbi:hypothetical protein LCER1_G005303 [Lachnellula cervina]|uniref:Ubiquitin-like domain-containing protein n=1 Tax=Lachnellula cervina TaxID=1316786 RepID=A0A7D8UXV4_9HELO|nr:hypothetical protein LCER1_G005303 [Lachnellula cervina]
MSVGFGFSVGDFLAAIELVGTLVFLENALLQVKRLEFDDGHYAQVAALRHAASLCQGTIDGFWKQALQYQPHLACDVKWALFKRDDVARFKSDLVGHTESINLLLAALQMSKATIHEKKLDEQHHTLAGRIQENYFSCMQALSAITEQGKKLFEMTTTVMTTNVKVFQAVLEIQYLVSRIPGQVERQQPVHLLDAMGRTTPFHLEFVQSAEALVAVLNINFRKHGRGAEKIERGEFAIQDSATTRDINLTADWERSFFPGQRVDMSMIITRHGHSMGSDDKGNCPICGHANSLLGKDKTPDIECCKFGMTYRRIVEEEVQPGQESEFDFPSNPEQSLPSALGVTRKRKRTPSEDEPTTYRRVRLHDKYSCAYLVNSQGKLKSSFLLSLKEFSF